MLKGSSVTNFIERHRDKIKGVISCFDRVVLTGTIPGFCYAEGMTQFLNAAFVQITHLENASERAYSSL